MSTHSLSRSTNWLRLLPCMVGSCAIIGDRSRAFTIWRAISRRSASIAALPGSVLPLDVSSESTGVPRTKPARSHFACCSHSAVYDLPLPLPPLTRRMGRPPCFSMGFAASCSALRFQKISPLWRIGSSSGSAPGTAGAAAAAASAMTRVRKIWTLASMTGSRPLRRIPSSAPGYMNVAGADSCCAIASARSAMSVATFTCGTLPKKAGVVQATNDVPMPPVTSFWVSLLRT